MAGEDIIAVIFSLVTGILMFFVGFYISQFLNPIGRAKLLTSILRKPHGIIWLIQKNDELEPHVVDFNKNHYDDKKNNRVYTIDNIGIYRQNTIRHQFKPADDVNDTMYMRSIKQEAAGDPAVITGKVDPNLLDVVIEQLKIIAEQKAMLEAKDMKKLIIGVGIVALATAGLSFVTYDTINNNLVPGVAATLNGLKELATKLLTGGLPRV